MILLDLVDTMHSDRVTRLRRHAAVRVPDLAATYEPRRSAVRVDAEAGAVLLTHEGVTRLTERSTTEA